MFFKKFGWIGITFAVAWLFSFAIAFWLSNSSYWQDIVKKPLGEQNLEINQAQAVGMIPKNTKIKQELYYTRCKHLEQKEIIAGDVYPDINEEALKTQGWTLYHNDDGSITIFKEVDGLCTVDMNKRHLGQSGEYVAILEGPVGVEGDLLEVLDIRVDKLPQEWQDKVRKGELDFSSEQELLEALDSIDEYE